MTKLHKYTRQPTANYQHTGQDFEEIKKFTNAFYTTLDAT
jgi:hypothetical protein